MFLLPILAIIPVTVNAAPPEGWQVETRDIAGSVGQYTSMALDQNGKVHISYYDLTNGSLKYTTNAGGSWVVQVVDNNTNDVGLGTSLAIDSNGKVHIAYYDNTGGDLKYANNVAGSWNLTTVDSIGNVGKYPAIALDSNGKAHISYYNQTNGDLKYATNAGGAWHYETVDSYSDVGLETSIAIDSKNKVHISYYNNTGPGLMYATNEGGSWAKTKLPGGPGSPGRYSSIAIDSNGKVHISHCCLACHNLRYTTNVTGSWVVSSLSDYNVGGYTSLAIDSNYKVHISYYDVTNGYLRYATDASGSWVYMTIDDNGNVGMYTSIAVDFGGHVHICYYDATSQHLKYVIQFKKPIAPTLVSATPGDGQVYLQWTAPSDNGGTPITNYTVYRGSTSGGESSYKTLGNVLNLTDTGLANGTTYYYKVSAVNLVGEGPKSNEVNATPTTPLPAPTLTTATPGNGQVELVWTAPPVIGAGITNYTVYRGNSSGEETFLITLGNVLTYTDPGLINGHTYYYEVSASNASGEGHRSNEVSATPATVPSVPPYLQALAGDSIVDLNWTVPAYVGPGTITYHLSRDGSEIWNGTLLNHTDTGVKKGVTYTYTVAAQNSIGWGPNCSAKIATPFGVPDAPWGLSITPGDGQSSLSWNSVNYSGPAPLTYHLFRDGVEVSSGTTTSFKDVGLTNGQTYSYNVAASNFIGWSDNSSNINGTPQGPPNAPTGLVCVPGDGFVQLNWTAPAYVGPGSLTYHLFRDGVEVSSGATTSHKDVGLTNGQTYSYNVVASNSIGWSSNSSEINGTPQGPPNAPTGLNRVPGDGFVWLNWTAPTYAGPGSLAYHLFRDGVEVSIGTNTSYYDIGLTNGQTYSYNVAASNSIGLGTNSSSESGTPQGPPNAPTGLICAPGNGFVRLNWTIPTYIGPGSLTYHLFRNGTLYWSGTSLAYNDTTVVNEIIYSYSVAAQNEVGWGINSSIVSATPSSIPMTLPSPPVGLEAEVGDGSVTLTWEAPSQPGNTPISGYRLYRSATSNGTYALIATPSVLTSTDTGVTTGQTYWYKVGAVNAAGEGPLCSPVSVSVPLPLIPISGKVVDANGNGLPNITVELENGTSVKTDDQGNFIIMANLGNHTLTISGDGIETRTMAANVNGSSLEIGNITTTESTVDSSNHSSDYLLIAVAVGALAAVLIGVLLVVRRRKGRS